MKKPTKWVLVVVRIVLGAGLFWIVASKTGGGRLALPVLASWIVLPVILLTSLSALMEAFRLSSLLRSQGVLIKINEAFRLVTLAFAFNFCVPSGAGGDLSKLYYLRTAAGGKGWELATVVFVDRLVGLFTMLLMTVVLGVLNWPIVQASHVLVFLVGVAVFLMAGILIFASLCLSKTPSVRSFTEGVIKVLPLRRQLERISAAFFMFSEHRGAVLRSVACSFLGNVVNSIILVMIGRPLFPQAGSAVAMLALFGMFANTITITPGGMGVGEVASDRLFAQGGMHGGAAVMILWRACMVPLCLLGLSFYVRGLEIKTPRLRVNSLT